VSHGGAARERKRHDELPVCLWKENSNRLRTLLDIVTRFNLLQLCSLFSNLTVAETTYSFLRKQGFPDDRAGVEILKEFEDLFSKAKEYFQAVGFSESFYATTMCLENLKRNEGTLRGSHLESDLRHIIELMLKETHTQGVFLRIQKEYSRYLDNPDLFGETVRNRFPSATEDIQAAGNCLATGCYTATVFHLMRVAERGLRALARDRRVKIPTGEILLATWEQIIRELEKAEQTIQGFPKTLAREAQFEFYHGAMLELRRFKNLFRNRFAHTRDHCDIHQAHSAFDHVGSFMKLLASRISETHRPPLVWRGKNWTTIQR
jgi:hypothetical protein